MVTIASVEISKISYVEILKESLKSDYPVGEARYSHFGHFQKCLALFQLFVIACAYNACTFMNDRRFCYGSKT